MKRSTKFSSIKLPDVMVAMPITGTVLPLDPHYPESNVNNAQSHNPEFKIIHIWSVTLITNIKVNETV
jgi:hypothetical protein